MITNLPTREQATTLAAAVRGGSLTDAQREQTALALGMIGSALRTAALADNPAGVGRRVAAGRGRVRPALGGIG